MTSLNKRRTEIHRQKFTLKGEQQRRLAHRWGVPTSRDFPRTIIPPRPSESERALIALCAAASGSPGSLCVSSSHFHSAGLCRLLFRAVFTVALIHTLEMMRWKVTILGSRRNLYFLRPGSSITAFYPGYSRPFALFVPPMDAWKLMTNGDESYENWD